MPSLNDIREPDNMDKASFVGYIPPLQSAIRTGGDGMRVTLEIPETWVGEAAKLIGMRQQQLVISVETLKHAGFESADSLSDDGRSYGVRE